MAREPEQVLNMKTGQYENCHVGQGCRLHFHQEEFNQKMEKTRDSLSIASDTENNWTIAKVMSPVGGAVAGIVSTPILAATAIPLLPALGLVGVVAVAGGLLTAAGFMVFSAIRKNIMKQKLKTLEKQQAIAKAKEDAEDDITSIEEYENPNSL